MLLVHNYTNNHIILPQTAITGRQLASTHTYFHHEQNQKSLNQAGSKHCFKNTCQTITAALPTHVPRHEPKHPKRPSVPNRNGRLSSKQALRIKQWAYTNTDRQSIQENISQPRYRQPPASSHVTTSSQQQHQFDQQRISPSHQADISGAYLHCLQPKNRRHKYSL